jgi:hypothetical protein
MRRSIMKRFVWSGATFVSLVSALLAQGTWTWQQQCSSNEWSAICHTHAGCGYDQNNNPVHRYFNNWGLSQCSVSPGLPGPGSICIFPAGANALLNSNVNVLSIGISDGATFSWQDGSLTLRNPSDNSPGTLTNEGRLRMVGSFTRSLLGVLVNSGTLIHEAGTTNFNGASLQNSGTAELRAGNWYNNTGTNNLVNTGTLNKTTTGSFTITVPLAQHGTLNVQEGTLALTAVASTQNGSWSVASGARLELPSGTHTFVGSHGGAIAGTLIQTGGAVQAGSNGATFNFTGTGYQWQDGTLNGGSAGLTNQGILRMVGSFTRSLLGVLVNSNTLIHEAGTTNFNGASLQNSGTAELRAGNWYNNTGTNNLVNTGTLNKTTTGSFTITVPMQQQNATVNVQAGTLTLSASSNTHQDVSWSVASGASLVLPSGTHTFVGSHGGAIAGTLIQTGGAVQAGSNGATFNFTGTGYQWQDGTLNGGSAGLTNQGILRMVGSFTRSLLGVLVNSNTLIHEAGTTNFNGASLQNSGTAELRAGNWYNNTGTNNLVNTGTLNKTTTGSFTITVPMQQQNATVNVQAGTLTLSASSNTHQDVSWSVASGASLVLPSGTHTFVGSHGGAIAGTLIQTGGAVQAGSNGATFNFTGTGYQWQDGTLNGGSAGLTNQGILRMVGSFTRSLLGVLVNSNTLIHEAGTTNFNGASLQNSGTAELRAGNWYNNTGTNNLVNTGTLNKTTTGSFTITVPMQQQNATVNVQAGTLTLSASSNTHQDVSWSVASGASLVLPSGTHTFVGSHGGAIAGTLIQTGGAVQAGSNGATFNFTGTGYQWQDGTLNGGSAGLTNQGILRMVGSFTRSLLGVLVNSNTLIHEAGTTNFNGASLQNSGTAELRAGNWYNNTGTNNLVNTGTLRKVSPDPNNPTSFSITVNTTNSGLIDVQNGTLSISNLAQTAGETRLHRGATLERKQPAGDAGRQTHRCRATQQPSQQPRRHNRARHRRPQPTQPEPAGDTNHQRQLDAWQRRCL